MKLLDEGFEVRLRTIIPEALTTGGIEIPLEDRGGS